ncbi:hypothetical protein GGTG_12470 [Gaeumannomyces tritici R3-111a-1]|uniref:Uncharacterized protein n=1 Tax=Gaeumannomyces tritici (strain R3-111a-1) TaxID=644352 RepID=J3PG43_GAET3|nr:hypothetical protein GGTG_12470 [Gaeumannomyces tritici R3-111a-1]EJT70298.1 hypothetical protein GGTG_12470 [Gaeumannomyces tritici R3-111a-1]
MSSGNSVARASGQLELTSNEAQLLLGAIQQHVGTRPEGIGAHVPGEPSQVGPYQAEGEPSPGDIFQGDLFQGAPSPGAPSPGEPSQVEPQAPDDEAVLAFLTERKLPSIKLPIRFSKGLLVPGQVDEISRLFLERTAAYPGLNLSLAYIEGDIFVDSNMSLPAGLEGELVGISRVFAKRAGCIEPGVDFATRGR